MSCVEMSRATLAPFRHNMQLPTHVGTAVPTHVPTPKNLKTMHHPTFWLSEESQNVIFSFYARSSHYSIYYSYYYADQKTPR
jgi:hypothetical protein